MKKNTVFLMLFISAFGCLSCDSTIVENKIKSKVLKHSMIEELREYFTTTVSVRVILSADNAKVVLRGLDKFAMIPKDKQQKIEDRFVRKLRDIIVTPVQEFFELLHQFRILLKPIVRESFSGTDINFETSLLRKFLALSKKEIKNFFVSNVKTRNDLYGACKEFEVLFGDLEATFSDEFSIGREWLKDQKEREAEKDSEEEGEEKVEKQGA